MSRRIFEDIEEAISREVRRITFFDDRTVDRTVLQDTFNPLTGEIVQAPIEPNFYDSSADTGHIQYPHFFIRLLKTREDRFSGRVIPTWGKQCTVQVTTSPKAYEIKVRGSDGLITTVGNDITTSIFQIRKVEAGNLLRLIEGNNKGTYIVDSITPSATGAHTITVSNDLSLSLPDLIFDTNTRTVSFKSPVDLNTLIVGDNFVDNSSNSFPINSIDIDSNSIIIGGILVPDLNVGGKFTRTGNVFQSTDLTNVKFLVMDQNKPIQRPQSDGLGDVYENTQKSDAEIPLDIYYLIRIDNKEKKNHTEILNRMWEEFNPPRTALPTIVRSALSAEEALTEDIPVGGSSSVKVEDNSNFNIGEEIFLVDDLNPTRNRNCSFDRPFSANIIGFVSTDEIVLDKTVPDTYKLTTCPKIISNATYRLFMFHFVDHVTKDVESAQYWVHEFSFWVQAWVDRDADPQNYSAITDIQTPIEDLETETVILDD